MSEDVTNPIRDAPAFRRLLAARTVSHVGDGIALIALVLLVQDNRGTGTSVGALLLATSIPRFLGPLAGVVVDRVEQGSLMVVCDLGQAAIFGTIAWLNPSFPLLLGLVALAAAFDTLFAPAGRSALPALVRPEQLMRANAWIGMSLNIRVAAGPVLGGLLVEWLDFRGALAANALSFVLSAALLLGLPPLRAPAAATEARGFLAVGMDGLRFAWRNRVVRTLIVALFVGVAFAGLDDVALVFLVRGTLSGSPLAYGLVTGAYGIGMLLGSLGLTWKGTAAVAGTVFLLGWVAGGIGAVLTGIAPLIALVAVGQAIAGVGNAVEVVAMDTLVQQAVPREMLGRIFGLVGTAAPAGHTLAFAAGGFLVDLFGPRNVFLIAGLGVLLVLVPVMLVLRRADTAGPEPAPGDPSA
ncbi:MAG TPA: MFS transporter [Actinomycetota bacterium]|nr:MFS transporter [Actinomycetota bacterium]